jgi:hypothetical protein
VIATEQRSDSMGIVVLEWFTAAVLVVVLAALAAMSVIDLLPASWRVLSLEGEILAVVGLLCAALLLVSALALLRTRDRAGA